MQLITKKVWSPQGQMFRVNLEDVADYVRRGFSETDPSGGTYHREPAKPEPRGDSKPDARRPAERTK